MIQEVKVRIPLHVSGFWAPIIRGNDYLNSGSLGAGLTLKPKALFRIELMQRLGVNCRITLNKVCFDEIPLIKVIDELLPKVNKEDNDVVLIKGECIGELGIGLGLSAALAISYSIGRLIELRRLPTLLSAASIAHMAEVRCLTGLADVIAEVHGGGLVVRVKPGAPGFGEVDIIPIKDNIKIVIAYGTNLIKGVTTPKMLSNRLDLYYREGLRAYSEFIREPSLENFLEISRKFSSKVGFINDELRKILSNSLEPLIRRGYVLGYFVKKSILLTVIDKNCIDDVINVLNNIGLTTLVTDPSISGTEVIM